MSKFTPEWMEKQLYQYLSRTVPKFLELRGDDVFCGLAFDVRPLDPGIGVNLDCTRRDSIMDKAFATTHGNVPEDDPRYVSEEERRKTPAYWNCELADQEVATEEDMQFLVWLWEDFIAEVYPEDGINVRLFEEFVEASSRALARLEAEIVHPPRFMPDALVFVIEECDSVDKAIERYQAVKAGTLQPGWAKF